MSLVLGVDSGGTKTLAALATREGRVVSLRRHASLDPSGGNGWQAVLRKLVAHLPDLSEISAAVFGLPFHGEIEAYSSEQIAALKDLMAIGPVVDNDVRIAFDGAFAGESGVLVLAGTGSMAWASLNGPGDPHIRVGGWGDAFGDEGSAYWIGRASLCHVARELDGRSAGSAFSETFLARLGLAAGELMTWCYGLENRRRQFAQLATITSELADDGDETAQVILRAAADELADALLAAWRLAAGEAPLRWSYAGGVTRSRVVVQHIQERVGWEPSACRLPPIGGALYRAAVHAGWDVTPAWVEAIDASLRQFPAFAERNNQEARK